MAGEALTQSVVVVGGGTAGWLAAAWIAASLRDTVPALSVTLVEAPGIPTVGVGEGTWPTMRGTLATIGLAEADFLRACDATFKQGSRFDGWVSGAAGDRYLHPFTPPPPGDFADHLAAAGQSGVPFARAMNAQDAVCAADLAPRQPGMPDYAGALNYGYHFDAGAFARLLSQHATMRLGVTHVQGEVSAVVPNEGGTIAALELACGRRITGDLFIDASGHAAVLAAQHLGIGWVDRSDVMFNDRALAAQVPVLPGSAIAAQTIATAHDAGWIWDIGLPARRGIGCVYASRLCSDERAEAELRRYIAAHVPGADVGALTLRSLHFPTGYRERFWHGNCIAIGQAAGFIEPLEASAIVMIELSLRALTENFPRSAATLPLLAERFNALFRYRWERVVEFLKLHYVLSTRDGDYWRAHRDPATIPQRLQDLLRLWQDQPPSAWDFPQVDEIFSAASHQYVLYGMGHAAPPGLTAGAEARARLVETGQRTRALLSSLPTNRAYADALRAPAVACQGTVRS